VVGDRRIGTVYTFEADGQPVWYRVDGLWSGQSKTITIDEYGDHPARHHRRGPAGHGVVSTAAV
jgi:hypothetical protein